MSKHAFWRGQYIGSGTSRDTQTVRYALYAMVNEKPQQLKQFDSYCCWDNARAHEASELYAERIEKEARAAGYEIIENPVD